MKRIFWYSVEAVVILLIAIFAARGAGAWDGFGWDQGKAVVASKTASFSATSYEDVYIVNSSGGGITVTLPTPALCAGKKWDFYLATAGNAVTLNAGTYSINGAVTNADLDAQYDSYTVLCTGTGFGFTARYIQ